MFQTKILDPQGERDELAYSGDSKAEAEKARDWAEARGLTAVVEEIASQ